VWQNRPLILPTCLLALAFVTASRLLHADDPSAADGYKIVPIHAGDKTVPIRVQEQSDPSQNTTTSAPSDGKYHPESINYGATSSMANKAFSFSSDPLAKSDPDFKNPDQSAFITKPYTDIPSSSSVPNLDAKPGLPATGAYGRSATGFDKSYITSTADADQNRTAPGVSTTSIDQNRTVQLGTHTIDTFPSSFNGKPFQGPEADAAKRSLTRLKNGQISVTDLPNRPLTIDEVRDLINHGFKPDTDTKAETPSKPLNDPDYKPEPLRDTPQPDASSPASDDENDAVPPPGTMATPQAQTPENSEPLPQP
jgi:hypothetical protein